MGSLRAAWLFTFALTLLSATACAPDDGVIASEVSEQNGTPSLALQALGCAQGDSHAASSDGKWVFCIPASDKASHIRRLDTATMSVARGPSTEAGTKLVDATGRSAIVTYGAWSASGSSTVRVFDYDFTPRRSLENLGARTYVSRDGAMTVGVTTATEGALDSKDRQWVIDLRLASIFGPGVERSVQKRLALGADYNASSVRLDGVDFTVGTTFAFSFVTRGYPSLAWIDVAVPGSELSERALQGHPYTNTFDGAHVVTQVSHYEAGELVDESVVGAGPGTPIGTLLHSPSEAIVRRTVWGQYGCVQVLSTNEIVFHAADRSVLRWTRGQGTTNLGSLQRTTCPVIDANGRIRPD